MEKLLTEAYRKGRIDILVTLIEAFEKMRDRVEDCCKDKRDAPAVRCGVLLCIRSSKRALQALKEIDEEEENAREEDDG